MKNVKERIINVKYQAANKVVGKKIYQDFGFFVLERMMIGDIMNSVINNIFYSVRREASDVFDRSFVDVNSIRVTSLGLIQNISINLEIKEQLK
jgi:hypothetical protein